MLVAAGARVQLSSVRLQRLGQIYPPTPPTCEEETPPVRGGPSLLPKCNIE